MEHHIKLTYTADSEGVQARCSCGKFEGPVRTRLSEAREDGKAHAAGER